jgi:hypothetical protein
VEFEAKAREANAEIRAMLSSCPQEDSRRLDRVSVFAAAVAERLGYLDDDLVSIRRAVYSPKDPCPFANILDVVRKFEAEVWPNGGDRMEPEAVLSQLLAAPSSENEEAALKALVEVAGQVHPID